MNWDSFFDDEQANSKTFTIWKKVSTTEATPLADIEKEHSVFEGPLLKGDHGNDTLKERWFVLKPSYFLYKKSKDATEVKAFLINRFMRVKTFSESEPEEEAEAKSFKIRFIRNLKYCDLFARNSDELQQWMKHLSKFMVRTDFHERFKVKKMLGEGSFAKVILVESGLFSQASLLQPALCH